MSENLELDELSESAGMDDEPVLKKDSLDDNFDIPSSASDLEAVYDIPVKVSAILGKTKMKEKEREIPFTSIRDVIYTPATVSRMASLQLITKEMPDVKRSYWYAYENNLVVVHPGNEELAQKIRQYILNPKGSDVVPPEFWPSCARSARRSAARPPRPRPRPSPRCRRPASRWS